MPRQLPPQPNLEFLKKQAKEHLSLVRQQNPAAQLADSQHALALEYGFESWPKLKAHVESRARTANPFAGTWVADVSRSKRHPANLFQSARIEVAVDGDAVTMTHAGVRESGHQDRGTNTFQVDGVERSFEHGYVMTARWLSPSVLEVVALQHGRPAGGGTYEVSADGRTMMVSTAEQRIVLSRERGHRGAERGGGGGR